MTTLRENRDIRDLTNNIIGQWENAPKLRALIEEIVDMFDEKLFQPLEYLEVQQNIDTAEGYWLNAKGNQFDYDRPIVLREGFQQFGFSDTGGTSDPDSVGFDQGPFNTLESFLLPTQGIGDFEYRNLLKMRLLMLVQRTTVPLIQRAVHQIAADARVTGDDTDDVISFDIDLRNVPSLILNQIRESGSWLKPAGVTMNVTNSTAHIINLPPNSPNGSGVFYNSNENRLFVALRSPTNKLLSITYGDALATWESRNIPLNRDLMGLAGRGILFAVDANGQDIVLSANRGNTWSRSTDLHSDNDNPTAITAYNDVFYVANNESNASDKIFGYALDPFGFLTYNETITLPDEIDTVMGMTSDDTYLYMSNTSDLVIYTRRVSNGVYGQIPITITMNAPSALGIDNDGNFMLLDSANEQILLQEITDPEALN